MPTSDFFVFRRCSLSLSPISLTFDLPSVPRPRCPVRSYRKYCLDAKTVFGLTQTSVKPVLHASLELPSDSVPSSSPPSSSYSLCRPNNTLLVLRQHVAVIVESSLSPSSSYPSFVHFFSLYGGTHVYTGRDYRLTSVRGVWTSRFGYGLHTRARNISSRYANDCALVYAYIIHAHALTRNQQSPSS